MSREEEIVLRDVANAGIVVSDRISRDVSAQLDLEDALEASRYTSHPYSTHPREWPPLVEVLDTWELPQQLIERYNCAGGEGTALCGIFPEIQRAWASVDNSLFLWRFDKWDGQCSEYNGEEQAICAVGLAKSKPSVFVEAVQYVLVLATPVELILLGVCCSARGDGTDPYAEVSLQPLPEYTVPSDGVTMNCMTCTDKGRIFLAGRDGHIYELLYTTGSGWHKRCRKVCLTSGLGSVIFRWVVPDVFKFAAVDPIVEMVIDNERCILYTRTEDMKLQVYVLGSDGEGAIRKVAEERNLINQKDYGGRQQTGLRATNRPAKPSIVSISPLSTLESKWLHLVVVLSDGRRVYLSTTQVSSGAVGSFSGVSSSHHKPNCIKVVTTRPSPPLGVSGGLAFGVLSIAGRPQNEDISLKVEAAHYSAGMLILSDSSPPTTSSLLMVTKDSSSQSSLPGGASVRGSGALRECVTSLPVEGRMLYVSDILPLPDTAATVQSLYSELEFCKFDHNWDCVKASGKIWATGDLSTQHIIPRRRIVIFSSMGMMEVAFNRPVDVLKKLLESNSSRTLLQDFFNRFGAGEAAAMSLMLAAKIVHTDDVISNIVAEKAAEAFEDPRVVGMPQLEGIDPLSNTRTAAGGFSMGQVVQEAEPVFSGAHEGLCLCSSRLLLPLWELPVIAAKGQLGSGVSENAVVLCRLPVDAMQVLENKLRSLEKFIRSRKNQRRGLYGCVAGLGDMTGSILYGSSPELGAGDMGMVRTLFGAYSRNNELTNGVTPSKRQRLPYSPAELAAMEVRAMECIRQLLLRCAEALFLLQLLSQHHLARLVQGFDANTQQELVQLTFHQLVCSEDGDQLATRLISAIMEYYTCADGRGTVDDISGKLREGCPSFFKEADYKFYLAVECLDRAAVTPDLEEKLRLARQAFSVLSKVPESADLRTVCKRFEDLRFYEAVVRLPLQKAQALDPAGDALNEQIDAGVREAALGRREQCYDIITSALCNLKGKTSPGEFVSPVRSASSSSLDVAARTKYLSQIVQLGVQSPDRVFHEYLYRTMIDLGLENELLEYGGPDLVPFLQNEGRGPVQELRTFGQATAPTSTGSQEGAQVSVNQAKYADLLARYYVMKRQHLLAAHVLLKLAERRSTDGGDVLTLEQRHQYLSNAVLQAKSASESESLVGSMRNAFDSGLLDLLEGKLAVLRYQMQIKDQLQALASSLELSPDASDMVQDEPKNSSSTAADADYANSIREKANEIAADVKSITQLYNEYAVPYELWEICLEMLYFANYAGDADSSIARELWARLIDQALSNGGVAEACSVLKRVGSSTYIGDGALIPLDTLCLHLEKAALERSTSGAEAVRDEDVARALLAICKGSPEPVLSTYDKLLSSGAILPSPNLRLRLLRSVLVVLREWLMSIFAQRMGTSAFGASLILGASFSAEQTASISQGVRDKIASLANRYMTEVRRLPLPRAQTEAVYQGFRELEDSLASPYALLGR